MARATRITGNILELSTKEVGTLGESLAAQFLINKGYTILARNVAFTVGEIDIIAQVGKTAEKPGTDTVELVFVEVKTRRGYGFGLAEAVSVKKFSRMRRAAARWLNSHKGYSNIRFDVITIVISGHSAPIIEHIEGVDCGAR